MHVHNTNNNRHNLLMLHIWLVHTFTTRTITRLFYWRVPYFCVSSKWTTQMIESVGITENFTDCKWKEMELRKAGNVTDINNRIPEQAVLHKTTTQEDNSTKIQNIHTAKH